MTYRNKVWIKDIDRRLTPSFCHLSLLSDAKVAKPHLIKKRSSGKPFEAVYSPTEEETAPKPFPIHRLGLNLHPATEIND